MSIVSVLDTRNPFFVYCGAMGDMYLRIRNFYDIMRIVLDKQKNCSII